MLSICAMDHASATGTDAPNSTWISDGAKNSSDASAWDIAPVAGSNLIFTAAHTGQCTIDQALTFGTITLSSGSGTVVQGSVDFGYSNLLDNGGTWTGALENSQTCSGNIVQSGGTITSNVLNIIMTGSGKNLQISSFNIYDLTIKGNTSILFDYAYVTHNIEIAAGVVVSNEGGLIWMPSFGNETFINNGQISGTNNLLIMTTGYNVSAFLGTISCPLTINLASWGVQSDIISIGASANLGALTVWSANARYTVTLDLNGHTLDVSSISVATGGNISSSLAGARINANNSIIVSADAELDTTNITVMIKPHTTNADDPSSIVLIALALGVVIALAIFLIRRRKKK